MSMTTTPIPIFDEQTGYILLKKGKQVQVIARRGEGQGEILFLWKRTKEEVLVTLDELADLIK